MFFKILLSTTLLIAAPETLSPAQRKLNLDIFEQVWSTVAKRYWDPKPGGIDWQKVHDEFQPKIEEARSPAEARAVINDMLGRLKLSHFGILPSEVNVELEHSTQGSCSPGLDLRVLEGKAIVTEVESGSPAAKAGVKPGWELLQANGTNIAPLLQKITTHLKGSTSLDFVVSRATLALLKGESGTAVEVVFNTSEAITALRLDRAIPKGKMITLGNMPPMPFWVEHRTLASQVRYIRFNVWMEPEAVAQAFQASMKDLEYCKGFVIDLRGNPGGVADMAMGVAGWFTDEQGLKLGQLILRDSSMNFVVFPRPFAFRGPLAILVDGCTVSTSEIFTAGMQDIGRARIFGTRTAGAALPSMFERLPNGDRFQYAIANYISDGGQSLEGRGVTPDEEVIPTQRELLAGKDPVLDHALAWIQCPNQ